MKPFYSIDMYTAHRQLTHATQTHLLSM